MEKDENFTGENSLPTYNNPTYEPSENGLDIHIAHPRKLLVPPIENIEINSEFQSSNDSGCISSINGIDPLESLRKLAREISPGITIVPVEKEAMSDPNSTFNTSFPTIIPTRRSNLLVSSLIQPSSPTVPASSNSKRESFYGLNSSTTQVCDSYWKDIQSRHGKRSSSLFSKRKSYNEEIFDIDEVLNIKRKYFGYTSSQWLILLIFSFINIFSAIIINLQAPFYPKIAEDKGATKFEVGCVFGSFEFVVFLLSPIFGKFMNDLQPKRVFNIGILITGICSILFGFLTFIENRYLFIALSFVLRIAEAIGTAGHVTATFTLIAVQFPDSIFTVFASMETCSGVGLILGPLLGSILYEIGSSFGLHFQFLLPFVTLGGILFIGAILAYFVMPEPQNDQKPTKNKENGKHGLLNLLKISSVLLAAFSIFSAAVSLGYHSSSLEPHIRQFDLEYVTKGAIFIINGGVYAICAPFIGKICDRTSNPKFIMLLGSFLILAGYVLIGPASFLPFDTILWVSCVGLFIQGLGLACSFVSAFTQAMRDALKGGFSDDVATYGLVSGLWMSNFALGNCVGPIASGFLVQMFNYRTGTLFVMSLQLIVILTCLIHLLKSKEGKDHNNSSKHSELAIHGGEHGGAALKQAKFFCEFSSSPIENNLTEK